MEYIKHKRDEIQIIRDIISATIAYGHQGTTKIICKANLSPSMFKTYISRLTTQGYVHVAAYPEGKRLRKSYRVTDKGLQFYNKLDEFRLMHSTLLGGG